MYCWTKEEWMTRTYVFINELNLMSFLSRKKYLSLTFTNINPISTTFHNVLIQTLMFMAQTFQQNFELFLKLKLKHNIGPMNHIFQCKPLYILHVVSSLGSLRYSSSKRVFLWLVYYNKSLTRDNLATRRHVEDMSCVFCCEPETIQHLFFDCIVAESVWNLIADIFKIDVPNSFDCLTSFWK